MVSRITFASYKQIMVAAKKIDLRSIKWLMYACQLLLFVFTAQWLISQYTGQHDQLKKDLTRLFTDVQLKISDSLISPLLTPVQVTLPVVTAPADETAKQKVSLSPEAMHKVLKGVSISPDEKRSLFMMDTIVFNELFTSQMKLNGWDFKAEWIANSDSNANGRRAIFIPSTFFTNENGIIVDNYKWYLLKRLLPQLLFCVVLLSLTALAFHVTFKSLNAQIKLGNLKDDFISNMSHELKTPIATVKVALEALNNFNAIDDKMRTREYLGMATAEMDRLELLATRVLNTSLLESGKIYLQQESYDLKKLVSEVLQNMQVRFEKHNAKVTFETTGNHFTAAMDKLHMQGVLVNLLDNSLKYGQSPVHIGISLSEQNGAIQLSLKDNGPGIPEEYREKVFEKFFRVPTGNRHNTKGYGLGLSYAAQVMRQHNGSINVNNIAEGGCVFTLTF